MNDERSFERFVADHVAGAAAQVRLPDDLYDDIHAFASRTRQRPEWLALIKEPPMRINSTVGVGSPIARVAAILATTLLLAVLGVGALVAGAQSPSPAPPEVQAQWFSGFQAESAGGACQIAQPTVEVVGYVTQERGESWGCQTVTTGDPRFSGRTSFIWNSDAVYGAISDRTSTGGAPAGDLEISAVRQRIENGFGAWEGTLTELHMGSEFHQGAGWFVGEGAYEGLAAYVMSDVDSLRIWGVIMPDDSFGPPPAFVEQ